LIADTPLSPLRASALLTPSPTTGHKNAADAVADIAQIAARKNIANIIPLDFTSSPPLVYIFENA
jgi:hypothetical protein